MTTQTLENDTRKSPVKRPKLMTFLAWLGFIASVLTMGVVGVALYQLSMIAPSLSDPEMKAIYENQVLMAVFLQLMLAALWVFQGVGLLKLKRWLPNLVYISFVIGLVSIVFQNWTFIVYRFSAVAAEVLIPLVIGGTVVKYIHSKRELFQN